jgi:hypothetical protein
VAFVFQPVRHVVEIVTRDGDHIAIEPGSWWELESSSGELMCTYVSADDGERRVLPRRSVRRLIMDGEDEEGYGFA